MPQPNRIPERREDGAPCYCFYCGRKQPEGGYRKSEARNARLPCPTINCRGELYAPAPDSPQQVAADCRPVTTTARCPVCSTVWNCALRLAEDGQAIYYTVSPAPAGTVPPTDLDDLPF